MTKKIELTSLQATRAVAALAVVFHHSFRSVTIHRPGDVIVPAAAYFPGERWVNIGAGGVDIFFVLSGFLMIYISSSYLRRERTAGDFLLKRLIRIWPLYAIFTLLGIAEAVLKLYRTGLPQYDLRFIRLLGIVFVPSINKDGLVAPIVGIGWTLTYEAFFYLCFALVLWSGRSRPIVTLTLTLGIFYAVGALAPSFAVGIFLHNDIIFEFLLGACVARFMMVRNVWPSRGIAWLAVGLVVLVGFSLEHELSLPRLITGGLPAILILIGVLALEPVVAFPRWLIGLGNASYSLYLSHIFVTAHVPNVILRALGRGPVADYSIILAALMTIAICMAVGLFVHLLVEKPTLRFLTYRANSVIGRRTVPAT